ncbi:hypothetical protein NDU88_004797 [Pleurodeles waltl]|uniref:Uncharacterized protein n=1 Tax=Pleurodeles waltl TaxID=8319 RepID=A0AAV7W600_PLEWA|nr:hypothetical protein NDU88_004797 [Pleurodeles waltl]
MPPISRGPGSGTSARGRPSGESLLSGRTPPPASPVFSLHGRDQSRPSYRASPAPSPASAAIFSGGPGLPRSGIRPSLRPLGRGGGERKKGRRRLPSSPPEQPQRNQGRSRGLAIPDIFSRKSSGSAELLCRVWAPIFAVRPRKGELQGLPGRRALSPRKDSGWVQGR